MIYDNLVDNGWSFQKYREFLTQRFLSHHAEEVHVGEWQSKKLTDPNIATMHELRNTSFSYHIPGGLVDLQERVQPNLPWAEDHFLERVSGEPLNPPPSEAWWPYAQAGNAAHKEGEKFSHTYPERFWPKYAGPEETCSRWPRDGIRYPLGDLADVVTQLKASPHTRQAFLPVWFPEDTGAVHGGRVPCTLGYLFNIRRNRLHCVYYIRSCDFLRHFPDDVYMAGRLMQWMVDQVDTGVKTGELTMHINSFHVFKGDIPRMQGMVR